MKIFTSYFSRTNRFPAGLKPVSISLYPPRGWTGECLKALAPSAGIL